MQHQTDIELLRQYAACGCDEAFATLVRRHINLVHSTALRMTRNRDLAQDVTQAVFVILSRKARSIGHKTILTGWLYRTARFAAADALRSMRRRERREQEAIMIQTTPDSDSTWEEIAPFLDHAMNQLSEKDRNLVLLRYFENKSLKEVGLLLGISDDTAQKRIARGLEKLRNFFGRHGVNLTATSLASLLSTQAVQAAPVAAAIAISGIGSGAMTLSSSTATIVKGTLNMLIGIQLKNAALITLALLMAAGAFTLAVQNVGSQTAAVAASATPLQALERLAGSLRNHDPKTFLSVVHAETPKGIALLSTTHTLVDAQSRFKRALALKFTAERAGAAMEDVNLTAFQFGQNNLRSAQVAVNGDQAVVSIPSRSDPSRTRSHQLVHRNGAWRLDVDSKTSHATDKNLAIFAALVASIDGTTREVQAGKYDTVEAAVEALKSQAIAVAMAQN